MILLVVELVAGSGLRTLISGGAVGWTCFGIVIAVWAVLMAWLPVKLKKAADENGKHKIKTAIAVVMLIPLMAALCGLGWFVITMMGAVW